MKRGPLLIRLVLFLAIIATGLFMLTRSNTMDTLMAEISFKDPQTTAMLEKMRLSSHAQSSFSELVHSLDINAQYELGKRYFNGTGCPTDAYSGVKLLESATLQGHVQAMEYLGYIYETGKNPTYFSHEKALYWYTMSANNGGTTGAYYLCSDNINKKNYKDAFIWCEIAANAGIPAAEATVGYMYASGSGVEKDLQKATFYICSAKEKGRFSRQALERYGIVCNNKEE